MQHIKRPSLISAAAHSSSCLLSAVPLSLSLSLSGRMSAIHNLYAPCVICIEHICALCIVHHTHTACAQTVAVATSHRFSPGTTRVSYCQCICHCKLSEISTSILLFLVILIFFYFMYVCVCVCAYIGCKMQQQQRKN